MWRIRFDDGAVLDSSQFHGPAGIPFERRFGVLWIYQGPEHDRLFNKTHYLWHADKGCWMEHDDAGLLYQLARKVELLTCYLQGSVVPRADWHACQREMDEVSRGNS